MVGEYEFGSAPKSREEEMREQMNDRERAKLQKGYMPF